MDSRILKEACHDTGRALNDSTYAVIGGAACSMLGSSRGTHDIDIVVPDGTKPAAISALRSSRAFGVEPGSQRIWYNASDGRHYNLDIIESSSIYQQFNCTQTETITVNGVRILKPSLMLNFKCFSWTAENRSQQKKNNDAKDISFLDTYIAKRGERINGGEVRFADGDFFMNYLVSYPETRKAWQMIGLLQ